MPLTKLARTLPEARREFYRHWSPRMLTGWLLLAVAIRVSVGQWAWRNLLVAAAVVVVQPFLEWVLHVTVLHDRPHRYGRFEFDTVVARDHRRHHADPRDVELVFIPRRWVGYMMAGEVAIAAAIAAVFSRSDAATAFLVMASIAIAYEWTHFLIHSDYKPKSVYYRKVYAAHRLHHYRNERYWFGVTNNVADVILGTYPDKDEVPVSATARNLLESDERVGSRGR